MHFVATCPGCLTLVDVPERLRGRQVRCKRCQRVFEAGSPPSRSDQREEFRSGAQSAAVSRLPRRADDLPSPPRHDEEDDDEDLTPRRRPPRSNAFPLLILGGAAMLVVVVGLLVGGGLGFWWLTHASSDRQAAEVMAPWPPPALNPAGPPAAPEALPPDMAAQREEARRRLEQALQQLPQARPGEVAGNLEQLQKELEAMQRQWPQEFGPMPDMNADLERLRKLMEMLNQMPQGAPPQPGIPPLPGAAAGTAVVLSNARVERGRDPETLFRVDYRFEKGGPAPGARYFLMIDAGRERLEVPLLRAELKNKGTMDARGLTIRAGQGPYDLYLEMEELGDFGRNRQRVSNTVRP